MSCSYCSTAPNDYPQSQSRVHPFFSLSTEFPVPKNELFQRFLVYYLGNVPVAKPVGKGSMGKESSSSHISLVSFVALTGAPVQQVGRLFVYVTVCGFALLCVFLCHLSVCLEARQ